MGGGKKKKKKTKTKTKIRKINPKQFDGRRDSMQKTTTTKKPSNNKKTLTPAQQRFKDREAKGLDGLTGMKKVSDAERKQGVTQLTQYRAAQKKQVQDAARIRNAAFQAERDVKSGQVPGQGGAMSAEARAAAAAQLAAKREADAKAEAAKKAEAARVKAAEEKNQRMFNPERLTGGVLSQTGAKLADTFAKPQFMYQGNPLGRAPGLSNYFSPDAGAAATYSRSGALKGIPFAGGDAAGSLTRYKVPAGAQLSRSPLGIRQLKLSPDQMKNIGLGITGAGDDVAGIAAKGGAKALGKFGARAIPFVGAGLSLADSFNRVRTGDYGGAALAAASAIPGPVGLAALGGLAAKDISQAVNAGGTETASAGGLNIGSAPTTDSGEGTPSSLGRALSQPNVVKGFGKDALSLSRLSLDRLLTPSLADGTLTGQMDFAGRLPGQQDFDSRDQVAMKAYDAATKSEGVKALAGNAGIDMGAADKALKALGPYGSQIRAGDRDATYEPLSKLAVDIGAREELAPVSRAIRAGFDKEATPLSIARAAFNPNAEGIPSISQKELGIAGGVGNRLLSGKATDAVREATVGYGDREGAVNAGLTPGSALSLGQMFDTGQALAQNVQNPDTLAGQRFAESKRLVGAGGKVTAGSLIRGSIPRFGGRTGSSTTPLQGTGTTGGSTQAAPMEELPIYQTAPTTTPTQTGTDTSNLQQIQQQSYMQNLARLGITDLRSMPQFRANRRTPKRFRSFRRGYF